eukprot:245078-Pelagomonas_calceolata.AAC.7
MSVQPQGKCQQFYRNNIRVERVFGGCWSLHTVAHSHHTSLSLLVCQRRPVLTQVAVSGRERAQNSMGCSAWHGWWDEIHKHCHASSLRVMVYNGQMQPGASSSAVANAAWAAPAGSRTLAAPAANPPAGRRAPARLGAKRAGASACEGTSSTVAAQQGGGSVRGAANGLQGMGGSSTTGGEAQEEDSRSRPAGGGGRQDVAAGEKPGAEGG